MGRATRGPEGNESRKRGRAVDLISLDFQTFKQLLCQRPIKKRSVIVGPKSTLSCIMDVRYKKLFKRWKTKLGEISTSQSVSLGDTNM